MTAHFYGRCLCGAVTFEILQAPFLGYACHCSDCQRRTGSAFSLTMMCQRESLEVTRGEPSVYRAELPDGRVKQGRFCLACATRLWGEPARSPRVVVLQPGVLQSDKQQANLLEPIAHIWTREAVPWMQFPPNALCFEAQADLAELAPLWRVKHHS